MHIRDASLQGISTRITEISKIIKMVLCMVRMSTKLFGSKGKRTFKCVPCRMIVAINRYNRPITEILYYDIILNLRLASK